MRISNGIALPQAQWPLLRPKRPDLADRQEKTSAQKCAGLLPMEKRAKHATKMAEEIRAGGPVRVIGENNPCNNDEKGEESTEWDDR